MPLKPVITLEEIQTLAKQAGYTIIADEYDLIVVKSSHPHVWQAFERTPDFSIDRKRAGEYALLRVFYWIHGYSLEGGEDGVFQVHRLPKHPASTLTERVALELDYAWNCHDHLQRLHEAFQHWIGTIEQLEEIPAPFLMANGERPEAIHDHRLGAHLWQPRNGYEGRVQAIRKWPNGDAFLWVQGNGYRFCDLEENLERKRSRHSRSQAKERES